jgi:hypothetical protein
LGGSCFGGHLAVLVVGLPGGRVRDELLEAPLKDRAFEEDATVAGEAAQADVGAEAGDLPVGAAAGMRAFETQDVFQVELEWRG